MTALNNDIVNLMNSTQVATIFLDNELCIKRFTPAVVGTFNLRSIDVGRPITDITQNLMIRDHRAGRTRRAGHSRDPRTPGREQ